MKDDAAPLTNTTYVGIFGKSQPFLFFCRRSYLSLGEGFLVKCWETGLTAEEIIF